VVSDPAAKYQGRPATCLARSVRLLEALVAAEPLTAVAPQELLPGTGPVVREKTLLTMAISVGASSAALGSGEQPEQHDQVRPLDQAKFASGSGSPGHPTAERDKATGDAPAPQPDQQAVMAAGPPSDLAAAVAEHLLAVAESHHPPAFFRADAIAALHALLGQLTPDLNFRLARRLLTIAETPGLNECDQAELNSQDPLSRGRLDLGARSLPTLALVTAATAAALAADASADVESLPVQATQLLVSQAVELLHRPDHEAQRYGATVLALAPRLEPGLGRYADALIVHPSVEVRSVAASMAILDEPAQRILAADSSPQVRARLAARSGELAEDIRALLTADEHPDVQRALARPNE